MAHCTSSDKWLVTVSYRIGLYLNFIRGCGHLSLGKEFIWTLLAHGINAFCWSRCIFQVARSQSHVIHDNIPDTGCAERMVASHGLPEHIVNTMVPSLFQRNLRRNGIKHVKSAPYHPASNGLAERFVQSLKQSLRASQNNGRSLRQHVCLYLLTYCSTPHATTRVQPCKLMVRDLRTHFSFVIPNCARSLLDKQSQQKSAHDYASRTLEWKAGDKVMARTLSTGPNWVPGIIAESAESCYISCGH